MFPIVSENLAGKNNSAFVLGYFLSFLKVTLNSDSNSSFINDDIYEEINRKRVLKLSNALYFRIFNEEIPSEIEDSNGLANYSEKLFSFISSKVQGGDGLLFEFSFFCGAYLYMSVLEEEIPVNKVRLGYMIDTLVKCLGIKSSDISIANSFLDSRNDCTETFNNSFKDIYESLAASNPYHNEISSIISETNLFFYPNYTTA
ncbi:MAG: hypothetical protein KF816_04050 [Melioribacteraceae bacterium]|nr:hypothetical protein [Melioribacteraceae bacterium]